MYRAYIAQHKYRVVLDGINDAPSTPTGLKGIRKVAEYFNSIGKSCEICLIFLPFQSQNILNFSSFPLFIRLNR